MKYAINKTNYNDFSVYEINKIGARAYFIPFSSKKVLEKTDYVTERYSSDRVTVLNGEWNFKYFKSVKDLPCEIDTDKETFDKVKVPSTWQRTGYEAPAYINWRYAFNDCDNSVYPAAPDASCAIYQKNFNIDDAEKNYIISFLGVISSLDLYINGKFVGYSEGAHNSAEFDITPYICNGENELVAVVYKWTNATYLECQDMFRENGIFRDVLLTKNEKAYINDIVYRTKKNDDSSYDMTVECQLAGEFEDCEVSVEIFDDEKSIGKTSFNSDDKTYRGRCDNRYYMHFDSLCVKEWNAEYPYVYKALMTLEKSGKTSEIIRTYIGFKTITITKDVYKFNSQPIKMKGVNHHDTDPSGGYVMDSKAILKDINLMKKLNVNTVRTSHYPPDPFFIIACTMLGIYVCDEADIETHGANDFLGCDHAISNNPMWMPRYTDRVKRMLFRDRNNPCIAMWSLGNESGNGICHDACYGILKAECPDIPVHYEGANSSNRKAYDISSNMYPPICSYYGYEIGPKFVKKDCINEDKPYFLCEYAHAMGIGPGALENYWDAFYSNDKYMGGCIWEWCDHAVSTYNKNLKYTYGGDHGERIHDGNFCVDGLIYPDRTPHTGAWEMKAVYRPIRAKYYNGNEFFFTNTNYFTNANVYDIKWDLLKNGNVVESGNLKIDVEPHSSKKIYIPIPFSYCSDEYHINFTYFRNNFEVAKEQCAIHEIFRKTKCEKNGSLTVSENGNAVDVSFDGGKLTFNKESGELESYFIDGKEMINQSPAGLHKGFNPNVWRAYHDNEKFTKIDWIEGELSKAENKLSSFEISENNSKVIVKSVYSIESETTKLYETEINYTVFPGGKIHIDTTLNKVSGEDIPNELPRFGLNIEMPKCVDNIEYYGRGEKENLIDFNAHTTIGIYKAKVEDTHEPYIYPQENGYHTEVRYLKVTDNDGDGLVFCNAKDNFSFNIHDYTVKAELEAMHQEELVKADSTVLNIDGFLAGTGTASCGPYTLEKYRVYCDKPLNFSFDVIPSGKIK